MKILDHEKKIGRLNSNLFQNLFNQLVEVEKKYYLSDDVYQGCDRYSWGQLVNKIVKDFQVKDFQVKDFQVKDFQVKDFQVKEFQIKESRVKESHVKDFRV